MANKIDWDSINSKLPYKKSPEAKAKRKELFDSFDVNDNGYISLAEVSSISQMVTVITGTTIFLWL